jgi:hypothetical protein
VGNLFQAKSNQYDLVFGEMNIEEIFNNIDKYQTISIKRHIFWSTIDLSRAIYLAKIRPDVDFIFSYKSNVLNAPILNSYKASYGKLYQHTGNGEGIDVDDFITLDIKSLPKNMKIFYLPCSLSVKEEFTYQKDIDICYFGTLNNRPNVEYLLKKYTNRYKIYNTAWDRNLKLTPDECYQIYKRSKITISEQINPVVLEYPVRLGESTSTGCRVFLLEKIPLMCDNEFVPEHSSYLDIDDICVGIENYLENFTVDVSYSLFDRFNGTYDNVIKYLLLT